NATVSVANAAANVTIVDTNTLPTIIVGDLMTRQAFSGNKNINLPVYLTFPSPTDITVNYLTLDGTGPNGAAGGADYKSANGTLTIPAGQTQGNIPLQLIGNVNAPRSLSDPN